MDFQVIGHRGACGYAPENTEPSFRLALQLGVDAIETDIQLTADGIPVLFHDDSLARTTDGTGPVEQRSSVELKRLDAGSWFHEMYRGTPLVFLDECLEIVAGRVPLVIELKGRQRVPLLVERAVAILAAHPAQKTVFSSFSLEALAEAERQAPHIERTWLVPAAVHDEALRIAAGAKVQLAEVAPKATEVAASWVAQATDAGWRVRAWGLPNDRAKDIVASVQRLLSLGVGGTTADYPDMVRSVCRAHRLGLHSLAGARRK